MRKVSLSHDPFLVLAAFTFESKACTQQIALSHVDINSNFFLPWMSPWILPWIRIGNALEAFVSYAYFYSALSNNRELQCSPIVRICRILLSDDEMW